MKLKSTLIALLALVIFAPTVYATSWSLIPTGSLDVSAGETVAFNLSFTATETFYVDGWDLEFNFDSSELQAVWDDSVPVPLQDWKIDFNAAVADKLYVGVDNSTGYYRASAGNLSSYYTINSGETVTFATLYFEVSDVLAWDGLPDLSILAQTGNFGFSHYYGLENLNGADGADVGMAGQAAVPVPAALWLLGSGLVGLAGIRRRLR